MSEKSKLIKTVLDGLLVEAPIDYGDRPERMDPDHETNLAQKNTTFSDHPAMPEVDPEGIPSDFPELMASKRFKDVIQDVIRFTGVRSVPNGQNGLMSLQRVLMTAVYRIVDLENGHREDLEQLAIDLVKQEFGIHDDDYQWDVKIIDIRNEQQQQEMQQKIQDMNNMDEEEQEAAVEEAIENLNDIELEKYKRRFMNAMIQGSGQKMNQSYYLVQERLVAIHPDLLNLYGTMMAVNDLQYWLLPDQQIEMAAAAGSGAGSEEIDNQTEPPTIKARGINFPVLVHEITKAVMEAIATHGLPDDETTARAVIQSEDTLAKEAWDLRLGPIIWEKFRAAYPEKLYDDDKRRIQAYLIAEFAKLPAEQFLSLAKEILSGSNQGKQRVEQIVDGILETLRDEEYQEFEYNQDVQNRPSDNNDDEFEIEKDFDPTDPSTW
jgi:hypothetical protein